MESCGIFHRETQTLDAAGRLPCSVACGILVPWPEIKAMFPSLEGRFLILGLPVKVKVAQLCPTLCNSMDSTVHGILQARILEWVAFPFSRGSSQPRDRTQVSHPGRFFTSWATREAAPNSESWDKEIPWIILVGTALSKGLFKRKARKSVLERRKQDNRSRDWSDAPWRLPNGSQNKECRQPLETGKAVEMDFPLRPSRRNQLSQHLTFSPVKLTLDLWSPKL